jgi:hypothetical protein
MAIETEIASALLRLERLFGGGWFMAGFALNLGDRIVSTGLKKFHN